MKRPILAVVGLAVIVASLMAIPSVQANFHDTPVLEVDIDIKPGKEPNSIKLNVPTSRGLITVAILGGTLAPFDVLDVDVSSLTFSGAAPVHAVDGDHFRDVNLDSYVDLVSHYRIQETGIFAGATTACLFGTLSSDGTLIGGCDSIRTIPSS